MKKTIYFLLLFVVGLLFSCSEDDLQLSHKQELNKFSDREERFFLLRDFSVSGKSSTSAVSIDTRFIDKLKILNQMNDFVCGLSDQRGLPLWQYAFRVNNTLQNKGGEERQDFLIIPMHEEGNLYLSSLLYIKYPDSENPKIHTITNDELLIFVKNEQIELYERESVLMTFFYFDQQVFGTERKYTNIPLELFENIPEAGIDGHEGHKHGNDSEEGYGYKEFDFEINEQSGGDLGRVAVFCMDFYHCTGGHTCAGSCDQCALCVSTQCYSIGGSGFPGETGGGGNTGGGNNGSGGNGNNNNNNGPWYDNYPSRNSFSPQLNSVLEKLDAYNITISDSDAVEFNEKFSIQVANKLRNYLTPNSLERSKFIRSVMYFLLANPQTVQPQNILERIDALEQYLYNNPYAISNIPCNQIPQWQEVAQHQVPQSVKDKLIYLNQMRPGQNYDFALQSIENASGSLVNNDYFAVIFDHLPNKPAPHQNQQFTAEEFLFYVRTNINEFVDTSLSAFYPTPFSPVNEGAIWYSDNPMNAVVHIEITGDDGSVIVSGQQSTPNTSHWIFTTIQVPFIVATTGADGPHPVSGHRKFGLIKSSNGSYTIYTRGVDRVQDGLRAHIFPGQEYMFTMADQLWESFQEGLRGYIQNNNTYSNTVVKNAPVKWRPNWNAVRNVLIHNQPLSTLGCQ